MIIYIYMDSSVMATIFTLKVTCGVLLRCRRLLGCSPLSPGLSLAQPTVIPPCFLSSSQAFWEVSSLDFPLPSGHIVLFSAILPAPPFKDPPSQARLISLIAYTYVHERARGHCFRNLKLGRGCEECCH